MTPLYLWVGVLVFYTLYLASINLWSNRNLAPTWVLWFASPVLLTMGIFDVAVQMTVATVVFADVPREMTLSRRFARYRSGPPGWRNNFATLVCTRLLNPFDPSRNHC